MVKQNIIEKLKECYKELETHIEKEKDYGFAEDALQNIGETIELLERE